MALKHRSPRHNCELPALLNESEPTACQIDVTAIDTLDPLVRAPLDVVQAELPRELAGHTRPLPPAQEPEHVGAVDDPILHLTGAMLLDEPRRTPGARRPHLAAEAGAAHRPRTCPPPPRGTP